MKHKATEPTSKFTGVLLKAALFVVCLWIPLGILVAGDIFKWTDKDGNVHYGAQPESSSAKTLNIKVAPTTSPDDDLQESEDITADSDTADADSTSGEPTTAKTDAAEIEAKNAEIRMKNCEIVKKRLASIQHGGRLYEVDDKGERHYWDDKTRANKLKQTQSEMNKWCN